jgi:hypothetical protein
VRLLRAAFVCAAAFTATACNELGYLELKTVPTTVAGPRLFIDGEQIGTNRGGPTVLKQSVGTHKLQTAAGGDDRALLCEIEVRKDRITTVTVSTLERPPRCQCARTGNLSADGRRRCIG